jgi:hypothetical protein
MRRTLVVSGFSILLAACGDDGGGADTGAMTDASTMDPTMDPTMGSDPTGTSTPTSSTTMDPTGESETMSETTGPACDNADQATIDMCVMGAMGMPDYCPEVGDCNCGSCACELAACQADEGCTAIRACAQEEGCLGIECLEPCGDVIEMYGGVAGMSGMIGLMLSACVEASGCPTQCPGGTGTGEGSGSGSGG